MLAAKCHYFTLTIYMFCIKHVQGTYFESKLHKKVIPSLYFHLHQENPPLTYSPSPHKALKLPTSPPDIYQLKPSCASFPLF